MRLRLHQRATSFFLCKMCITKVQKAYLCSKSLLKIQVMQNRCTKCSIVVGPGIKPEDRERIFQRFEMMDYSNNHNFKGSGLGLGICKQIIECMGGKIGNYITLFRNNYEYTYSYILMYLCLLIIIQCYSTIPSTKNI